MRIRLAILTLCALPAACIPPGPGPAPGTPPPVALQGEAASALILVDKSDRTLVYYRGGEPVATVTGLAFGGAPVGHKSFEGDERMPEGMYQIDAGNPASAYHLSLRISYPDAEDRARAAALGRDPGGDIFLHGQPGGHVGPPLAGDWTDGCIAMADADIERLYALVADGTPILIRR